METIVLAVDGGATKTEVMLAGIDGTLLARARGGPSNHQMIGIGPAIENLVSVIARAGTEAGFKPTAGFAEPGRIAEPGRLRPWPPTLGVFCLAGIDFTVDEQRVNEALTVRMPTKRILLRNDTFALLRAGIRSHWGIATVCGTGLNCAGIGPDGATVRFPSLGELSGDFTPGGLWLGVRALGLALRAGDGRGPETTLRRLVAAHFDLATPEAVLQSVYTGAVPYGRLPELAEVALDAAADGDVVAGESSQLLVDEIVTMTAATIRRLGVTHLPVEVVLGGGIFETRHERFTASVRDAIRLTAPEAVLHRCHAPPVLGAALLGLDLLTAPPSAHERLRVAVTDLSAAAPPPDPRAAPTGAGPHQCAALPNV